MRALDKVFIRLFITAILCDTLTNLYIVVGVKLSNDVF
jgi:hypothetical protein